MPCHLTVDYEDKNWRERMGENARQCTGAAIFFANMGKLSRQADRGVAKKNMATVFVGPTQFLQHHLKDPRATFEPMSVFAWIGAQQGTSDDGDEE